MAYFVHLDLHIYIVSLEILHRVKWYQVFLSNTNNLQTDLFDP